ncbi:MAG: tetratricopeptide repeat protein [Verrucomicrobia bacterium]|nr:tetratricopeptide repeat protein [Verrucomicrobiota bacterium]
MVLLITLAYAPTLRAPFIFDDTAAVLQNSTIRDLWSFAALNPPADGGTTTGRPLVNVSLALNYALSGESPWSYHATNLVIHLLAALTLFGLVRRTALGWSALPPTRFPAPRPDSTSPTHRPRGQVKDLPHSLAFFTALLWSLHPLLTETVACPAQRTESLCALFYLLTLYAFARGTVCHPLDDKPASFTSGSEKIICHLMDDKRVDWRWLGVSGFSCLAGMASKEVMVTAPLVVLLFDRTFVAGSFAAALRERRAYYAALAATWLLLAWLVLRHSGARGVAAGFGLGVTPWTYLLTQCDALVRYLALAIWPHPLVLDYGTATIAALSAVWWPATFIVGALAATVAAVCDRRPTLRTAGFLAAAAFLMLAPSSSFVPLVTQTIAEHRMYLPLAALCLGLVFLGHRALGRQAPAVLATLALVGGVLTFARAQLYRTPVALWQHDVAHRPHARSLTALGVALLHAGEPAAALPHFDRALALDPAHLSAQRNRALALLHLGRAGDAATILATLPAREPGEAGEFFALGNAFAREQKFAEAAAAYTRTVALEPAHLAAHANLGNALLLSGHPAAAIVHYETVLRLQPGDARAQENLQLAREALRAAPNR